MSETRLLDQKAVAEMLGISIYTVKSWRDAGIGPKSIRIGRCTYRYRLADIEAYLRESELESSPA